MCAVSLQREAIPCSSNLSLSWSLLAKAEQIRGERVAVFSWSVSVGTPCWAGFEILVWASKRPRFGTQSQILAQRFDAGPHGIAAFVTMGIAMGYLFGEGVQCIRVVTPVAW